MFGSATQPSDRRGHTLLGVKDGRAYFLARVSVFTPRMAIPAIAGSGDDPEEFYADAMDGDLTSGDANDEGYMQGHADYDKAQAGTGNEGVLVSSSGPILMVGQFFRPESEYDAEYIDIRRPVLPFDTSSLGSGAIVESATLKPYVSYLSSASDWDIVVVEYTGGLPITIGDWTKFGDTPGGTLNRLDAALNEYNSIELNAAGLALINPTGMTKLALRSSDDIDYQVPDGEDMVYFRSRDYSEGTLAPILEIVYSVLAMSVNIGGTWKQAEGVWVNIGGVWKPAVGVWTNIGGVWKQS